MKNVLRMCLGLILLSGCQVATGLSDLELVREVEEPDAGPTPPVEMPVAGTSKPKPPKAGSAAPSEAGSGGGSAEAGSGGGAAEAGGGGTGGAGVMVSPVTMMSVAQAGSSGSAAESGGSGGAGGAQAEQCEISNDAECNIFDNCGCEGRLACGVVKAGESFAIGCTNPGRAQIGSACEGISSCVPGSLCIGKPATCRKTCEADSECGAGAACLGVSNLKGVGFCAQTCVSNGDCATNCCQPSGQGVDVCVANTACETAPPNTDPEPPITPNGGSGSKAAGEMCSSASECKDNDCYKGYCYGAKRGDAACSSKYECHSGACTPEQPVATSGVCLEPTECIQQKVDTCYIALALKVCQVMNKCGSPQASLSACVNTGCNALPKDYTVSECQSLLQSLGDNPACPASSP